MKILVLGSTGMLGHKMIERLRLHYENVDGVCREDGFNAMDLPTAEHYLEICNPHVIINCMGIIKQRNQKSEESIAVNALFPHVVQRVCSQLGSRLIHFSTDCVFSGKTGQYKESDAPDPEDLYGTTKHLGEVIASNTLTLRTSIIGREKRNYHGLLEWFLRQNEVVSGFANVFYTGVTTNWLADTIADLIQKPLSGLYHVAAPMISKDDLLRIFRDVYDKSIMIKPVHKPVCNRSLNGGKFEKTTGIIVPTLSTMVAEQYEQDLRSDYVI